MQLPSHRDTRASRHITASQRQTDPSTKVGQAQRSKSTADHMDEDFIPLSQTAVRTASRTAAWLQHEEEPQDDGLVLTQEGEQGHGSAHGQQGNGAVAMPAHHRPTRHGKIINDVIHGTMRLDPLFIQFVDTRPFQRLRDLKQLGSSHWVWPGASHTRFEHSLGVCWLAFTFAETLLAGCRGRAQMGLALQTEVRRSDTLAVGLAGLCHDLGHGPFSHVWDSEFCKVKGITDWTHEDMSCRIFDYIRDIYHIDSVSDDQAQLVKQLIGGQVKTAPDGKAWLFDIVANSRNSLDVDKADYLPRDAKHVGVKISCDFPRLMSFAMVFDDQVCYKASEYYNIMELFHSRLTMHKRVYTHKKAKAVEFMIVDALMLADEALKFSESMNDPASFSRLDDTLLRRIEDYDIITPHLVGDPNMKQAKDILDKLRDRQIYKFVNEVLVPDAMVPAWKQPTPADLCSYWHANGEVQLNPDEVIISTNRINWAMKDRNPLNSVQWFDHHDDEEPRLQPEANMSSMIPSSYQDVHMRVFSKNRDQKVVDALNTAMDAYIKHRFGNHSKLATPCRAGLSLPSSQGTALRGQGQLLDSVIKSVRPTNQLHNPQLPPAHHSHVNGSQAADVAQDEAEEDIARQKPAKRRRSLAQDLDDAYYCPEGV